MLSKTDRLRLADIETGNHAVTRRIHGAQPSLVAGGPGEQRYARTRLVEPKFMKDRVRDRH